VPSLRLVLLLHLWLSLACELHKTRHLRVYWLFVRWPIEESHVFQTFPWMLKVFFRLYCEFRVETLNADLRIVSPQCQEMEAVEADNAPMLNSIESE
jgi:hypothetical protein